MVIHMDKKYIIGAVVLVLAVGAGAFYGGMKYDQVQRASQFAARGGGFGQPGSGGTTGRTGGQRGTGAPGGIQNGGAGDFSGGQITAKDDTSVTVKTRNGSSQIVFLSPSTTVGKSVSGSASDLSVGQEILANGKNNPDGSLAATNIQIRPDTPTEQ